MFTGVKKKNVTTSPGMFSLLGTTGFKAHKLQVEYDVSDIKQVIVII